MAEKVITLVGTPAPVPAPPSPRDPRLVLEWNNIHDFGRRIVERDMSPLEECLAVLWYRFYTPGAASARKAEALLSDLVEFRIRAADKVEVFQLFRALVDDARISVSSKGNDQYFSVDPRAMIALDESYRPLVNAPRAPATHQLLESIRVKAVQNNWMRTITEQINGTYEDGYYDACAPLCRRLAENLLIIAFESNGGKGVIRDKNGEYLSLSMIIDEAKQGQFFKLQRNTPAVLGAIKAAGDKGAHDRFSTVRKAEIDAFKNQFTDTVRELLTHGKLDHELE